MLPLVNRTARALGGWLSPAYGGDLRLVPDTDEIPALSGERDALWARLQATTFLTDDEKRAAVGYGAKAVGGGDGGGVDGKGRGAQKFNPNHDHVGRFTFGPSAATPQPTPENDPNVVPVARRRGGSGGNPGQEARLGIATARAKTATQRVGELDPTWQAPRSFTSPEDIEGQIRHQEAVALSAEARLAEITRDAIPNTNPSWGVNRLRKELNDRGFTLDRPTDAPGFYYKNPSTNEEVRIMERPDHRWGNDPAEKHYYGYYYRYRPNRNLPFGNHTPIPDKN